MNLLRISATVLLVVAAAAGAAETTAPDDTNWLSYNHNVNGQRYVPLDQINRDNAAQLGEVCRLKVEDIGAFHTALLHVDGVLYFTNCNGHPRRQLDRLQRTLAPSLRRTGNKK